MIEVADAMKRISVKKWYRPILFLLLFSLLVGCQQSDAGSHTGSVQITPTDQIHVESMTLLEQVEYTLVPDAEHASVELYTSALIADDGQMGWDSGDQWMLIVRHGEQKWERVDAAVDELRERYGYMSVRRALTLADPLLGSINPKDDHTVHPVGYFGG